MDVPPKWLDWAQRLQAIAQTGLTFQIARFFEHYRHPDWATDFD